MVWTPIWPSLGLALWDWGTGHPFEHPESEGTSYHFECKSFSVKVTIAGWLARIWMPHDFVWVLGWRQKIPMKKLPVPINSSKWPYLSQLERRLVATSVPKAELPPWMRPPGWPNALYFLRWQLCELTTQVMGGLQNWCGHNVSDAKENWPTIPSLLLDLLRALLCTSTRCRPWIAMYHLNGGTIASWLASHWLNWLPFWWLKFWTVGLKHSKMHKQELHGWLQLR